MKKCNVCGSLKGPTASHSIRRLPERRNWSHQDVGILYKLDDLKDAVADSCSLCALIWDGLRCCVPEETLSRPGWFVNLSLDSGQVWHASLRASPNLVEVLFALEFFTAQGKASD